MKNRFIDTHCHLEMLKDLSTDDVLNKCHQLGVEKCITIGTRTATLDIVYSYAKKYQNVFTTLGLHPHEAKDYSPDVEAQIKTIIASDAKDQKIKAIGEIGLDYHYNHSPQDIQKNVFEQQLELAKELNLPVVIHTREAEEDTISILKNHLATLKKPIIFHSFTSNKKLAEFGLNHQVYFGFNGIITFKNSLYLQDLITNHMPEENILFETDAPFLTPIPYRGKENAPYHIPLIANKICELKAKQKSSDEFFEKIYQNSCLAFGL